MKQQRLCRRRQQKQLLCVHPVAVARLHNKAKRPFVQRSARAQELMGRVS